MLDYILIMGILTGDYHNATYTNFIPLDNYTNLLMQHCLLTLEIVDKPCQGNIHYWQKCCQCACGLPSIQHIHMFSCCYQEAEEKANSKYFTYWHGKLSLEHRNAEIKQVIKELTSLNEAWINLANAKNTKLDIIFRRECLKKLHELLGDEAYYSGKMPPHIPLWAYDKE